MAVITDSLGRRWNSAEHPRDRKGRFIRTFRSVKIFDLDGLFGWASGKVTGITDEDHINVEITNLSRKNTKKDVQVGQTLTLPAKQLESIPEKARLSQSKGPKWLTDWASQDLGAPNATISGYARSLGFSKEERDQINNVLNGKQGKNEAGKYAIALYALNRSYDQKHLSGKSEQSPEGQQNFIETLDWLGVPDDLTDNTPDGKSGLEQLLKEYNASKSEGEPKDLLPRIASRELDIDGERIGLEESTDPHLATHFYRIGGTSDEPEMTKIENAEHNPTVEDLDFDQVKAFLKDQTPAETSETPETGTPEAKTAPETPEIPENLPQGDLDDQGNPVFRVLPPNERGKSGDGHTSEGHWGLYGASGGLISAPDPVSGEKLYLLFQSKIGQKVKGSWILPGGAKEEKETPEQGFARELQEELKVSDEIMASFKLKGKSIYTDPDDPDWEYQNLAVEAPEIFDPDTNTEEGLGATWFTEDQLAKLVQQGKIYDKLAAHLPELLAQHKGEAQQITEQELPGEEIPEFDLFPEVEAPLDISEWTHGGAAGGSNGAKIMTDENGDKWFVKKPKSKDIGQSEYLANKFYEELGIPVPEMHPAVDADGNQYLASKAVAQSPEGVDFKQLMGKINAGTPLTNDEQAALSSIHDGFLADVFLDNYDVKGADGWEDNIIIDEDGIAYRIDNGSSLLYSATGKEKKPGMHYRFFDDKDLIDGFLKGFQGGIPINTSKLFAGVTSEQKKQQAQKLAELDDQKIDFLVDSTTLSPAKKQTVKDVLKKRRDLILEEVKTSEPKVEIAKPEPETPEPSVQEEPNAGNATPPGEPPAGPPTGGGDEPPGDNASIIQAAKDADPFFEVVQLANGDQMARVDGENGYTRWRVASPEGEIKFYFSVPSTADGQETSNALDLAQAEYDKNGPTPYVQYQNKLKPSPPKTTPTSKEQPPPPTPDAVPDTSTPPPAPAKETNKPFTQTEPVALEGEAYPPTREQQDIIDAVTEGHDTKVLAGAGSGKTSTIVALAKRLPGKKILYVAFNKSVQTEAEERMPKNVEPRTGHSLAYAWSKVNAPHLLKKMNDKQNQISSGKDIADYLGVTAPDFGGMDRTDVARGIIDTVAKFATSAEDQIEDQHLSDEFKDATPEIRAQALDLANKAWEDISKNPNGKLKVTHDHYRKVWALSKPDLSNGTAGNKKADIVIIDEAQDTPPVLAKVIADQQMQKVVVGDENQAIYGFTGAVDYLSQAEADVDLPLTKSWRFGKGIADAGNRALQMLGSTMRIIGGGKESTIGPIDEPDAILTRTNGGMLKQIIEQIDKGRTVGVPVGTKRDIQSLLTSAFNLKIGKPLPKNKAHDDIAPYSTWAELSAAADKGDVKAGMIKNILETHDYNELKEYLDKVIDGDAVNSNENLDRITAKISPNGSAQLETPYEPPGGKYLTAWDMVKEAGLLSEGWGIGETGQLYVKGPKKGQPKKGVIYKGNKDPQLALKEAMDRLNQFYGGEQLTPDVTISTAHKSKGLEWDKVQIGDDFKGPQTDENGKLVNPPDEELKLAYVALTRAKTHLDPGSLSYVYDNTDENGGTPPAPKMQDLPPDDLQGKLEIAKEELSDKLHAERHDTEDPAVSLVPDPVDEYSKFQGLIEDFAELPDTDETKSGQLSDVAEQVMESNFFGKLTNAEAESLLDQLSGEGVDVAGHKIMLQSAEKEEEPLADWEKELLGISDEAIPTEDLPELDSIDTQIKDLQAEIGLLDQNDPDFLNEMQDLMSKIVELKKQQESDNQPLESVAAPPATAPAPDVVEEPTLKAPNGESEEFLKLAQAYYKKGGGAADLNKDELQQIVQLEYTLKNLPEGTTLQDFLPEEGENPKLTNALALMQDEQGQFRYFTKGPEAGTKMHIGDYVTKRFKNGKIYSGVIIGLPNHSQPNVTIGKLNPDGTPMIDEFGHWEVARIHIGEVRKHYGYDDNGKLLDDGEPYSSPHLFEGYHAVDAQSEKANAFKFVQGKEPNPNPTEDPGWNQAVNDAIFSPDFDVPQPLPGGYEVAKHVDGMEVTLTILDPEGNAIGENVTNLDVLRDIVNNDWNMKKEEPESEKISDLPEQSPNTPFQAFHKASADNQTQQDFDGYTYSPAPNLPGQVHIHADTGEYVGLAKTDKQAERMVANEKVIQNAKNVFPKDTKAGAKLFLPDNFYLENRGGPGAEVDLYRENGQFVAHYDLNNPSHVTMLRGYLNNKPPAPAQAQQGPPAGPLTKQKLLENIPIAANGAIDFDELNGKEFDGYIFSVDEDGFSRQVSLYRDDGDPYSDLEYVVSASVDSGTTPFELLDSFDDDGITYDEEDSTNLKATPANTDLAASISSQVSGGVAKGKQIKLPDGSLVQITNAWASGATFRWSDNEGYVHEFDLQYWDSYDLANELIKNGYNFEQPKESVSFDEIKGLLSDDGKFLKQVPPGELDLTIDLPNGDQIEITPTEKSEIDKVTWYKAQNGVLTNGGSFETYQGGDLVTIKDHLESLGFEFEPDPADTPNQSVTEGNSASYTKQDFINAVPITSDGSVELYDGTAWEFPDGSTAHVEQVEDAAEIELLVSDPNGDLVYSALYDPEGEPVSAEDIINDYEFQTGIKFKTELNSKQDFIDSLPKNSDGTLGISTGDTLTLPNGNFLLVDNVGETDIDLMLTDKDGNLLNDEIIATNSDTLTPEQFVNDLEKVWSINFEPSEAETPEPELESEHKDMDGKSLFVGDTFIDAKTGQQRTITGFTATSVQFKDENGNNKRRQKKFVRKVESAPVVPQQTGKPDPSSPWYQKPEPEAPGFPPSELSDAPVLSAEWLQKVKEHWEATALEKSSSKAFEKSHRYQHYIAAQNGSLSELEWLMGQNYLPQDLYDEAKAILLVKAEEDDKVLQKFNEEYEQWTKDHQAWALANGKPFYTLKGMDAPAKDFTKDTQGGINWGNKFAKGIKSKLTQAMVSALYKYTGSGYQGTNKVAYNPTASHSTGSKTTFQEMKKAMEVAPPIPEDIIIVRGVGLDSLVDPATGKKYQPQHMPPAKLMAEAAKWKGTVITNEGFSSSSPGTSPGFGSGHPVWLRIRVPKGTKGIYVSASGSDLLSAQGTGENELILDAGQRFYVHDYELKNGKVFLHVEIVPVDFVPPPVIA